MGSALCFPCSGQRPAGDGEKELLASPMDAMFPSAGTSLGSGSHKEAGHGGELLWAVRASQRGVSQKTALGGTLGVEKWPCAPAGPSPAWGNGCRGLRAAPLGYPSGTRACCLWGHPPRDAGGGLCPEEAARAPRPLAGPWDRTCSKSGLAGAPGQRCGPVRPGYAGSELAHDARRGAKG